MTREEGITGSFQYSFKGNTGCMGPLFGTEPHCGLREAKVGCVCVNSLSPICS